MVWVIIIVGVVTLFVIVAKNSGPVEQHKIEVTAPDPERCQDKTMIDYIDKTPGVVLEQVFKKYVAAGKVIKPLYLDAFRSRMNGARFDKFHYYTLCEGYVADSWNPKGKYENIEYITLAGVHVPARKTHIRLFCSDGDLVELLPEPKNKFDPDAIRVRRNGRLIGYIPADDCEMVHGIINGDYCASISSITEEEDGYLDVEIEISY